MISYFKELLATLKSIDARLADLNNQVSDLTGERSIRTAMSYNNPPVKFVKVMQAKEFMDR